MPVMDGWEFRVEQRADPMLAGIPLLAMSADLSAKARAIAADVYVRKPIDFPELLRQLRDVVGRAARAPPGDRRPDGRARDARVRHRARDQQPAHLRHREPADAGRAAARLEPTRRCRDLSEVVADALEGAERIRRLVKQVQMVSPGQHDERLATVALRDAAADGARADREPDQAPGAPRAATLELDVYVRGDRERIEQLFVNLLLNAAQAIPEGQRAPRTRSASACASCPDRAQRSSEIEDTGTGIPLEVQERIFQPFFTTKPVGQGTGLGLSICRGIVTRARRADIAFQSEPASGTTFRVVLPTTGGPAA